jgi:electron transfer flavoprotein beta subunit
LTIGYPVLILISPNSPGRPSANPIEHGRGTFRDRRNGVAYHLLVCFDPANGSRVRTAGTAEGTFTGETQVPPVTASADLHALEAALLVRDKHPSRITAIVLGPPSACGALREALYRGADRAILISDPRSSGADSSAAAYVLSCAVRKLSPDVVFFGARSDSGQAAHIAVQVAEKAGLASVTRVDRPIEVDGRTITARRNTGAGWELVSVAAPVLLNVWDTANSPRPPAMRRMMKYKKALSRAEVAERIQREKTAIAEPSIAPEVERRLLDLEKSRLLIETWDLDDLGADPSKCGRSGSPTRVERAQSFALSGGASKRFASSDEGLARLVGELLKDHSI